MKKTVMSFGSAILMSFLFSNAANAELGTGYCYKYLHRNNPERIAVPYNRFEDIASDIFYRIGVPQLAVWDNHSRRYIRKHDVGPKITCNLVMMIYAVNMVLSGIEAKMRQCHCYKCIYCFECC
jgi:hypothetical protein